MATAQSELGDASDRFEDLSGTLNESFDNPYDALIAAAVDAPVEIQRRYSAHRETRSVQQKARLLDPNLAGLTLDPILQKLYLPNRAPGYVDPRHCLVFWARPPGHVRLLIQRIQSRLQTVAPNLWLMPLLSLHMTALEITHSRTAEEIAQILDTIRSAVPNVTDYTFYRRARLIKPMISYDGAAVALSFVPAAGEALEGSRSLADDEFTYHHLRRDLFARCQQAGATVESRYTVPSAHLTIARFITGEDHESFGELAADKVIDGKRMERWIKEIEDINVWLESNYWPTASGGAIQPGGQWIVGQEQGLDCRYGTLWYGGGSTVRLGQGF